MRIMGSHQATSRPALSRAPSWRSCARRRSCASRRWCGTCCGRTCPSTRDTSPLKTTNVSFFSHSALACSAAAQSVTHETRNTAAGDSAPIKTTITHTHTHTLSLSRTHSALCAEALTLFCVQINCVSRFVARSLAHFGSGVQGSYHRLSETQPEQLKCLDAFKLNFITFSNCSIWPHIRQD